MDDTLTSLLAGPNGPSLKLSARKDNYSVDELMIDLRKGFSELNGNSPIDMYRRNEKKLYVDKLIGSKPGTTVGSLRVGAHGDRKVNLAQTDLPSIARGQLLSLKSDLKTSTKNTR
jgi:hypothetical protein